MLFLWLVLIQLAIFGGLVYFLKVVMTRHVTDATSHLSEINEDYTQKLEEARRRVQEAEKKYEETVSKAKTDAEKLKTEILESARKSQELTLNESRQKSEQILESAEKTKAAVLKEIDDRIAQEATATACHMLRQVLPEVISKPLHEKWVEELLKQGLEELDRLSIPKEVAQAKVYSAHALSPDQKSALLKKFKEKLGRDIGLIDEVKADLIAGLSIVIGTVTVDGSLKNRIREFERHAHTPAR